MALNKSQGLQLFQGELTVQHHKNVEMTFKSVKYASEHLKGTKTGQMYLTNFRLFFVNDKSNDMVQTFSMPFKLIKDFEIKQPLFGANLLEGKILAEEGGGWQGSAKFEIIFKSGGAVEVGQDLVKMAKNPQMMYMSRQPPMIMTPGATILTTTPVPQNGFQQPQNGYQQPPNGYPQQSPYAPPPTGYQPTAPPAYMPSPYPQQPPMQPYPQPYPQPYSQQGQYNGTVDAKAAEAMASSSTLPPGYDAAVAQPPPYDAGKKNQ